MTARRNFPNKVKAQAFEKAKGRCEGCTVKLPVGKTHYDHVVPDALGGEPTLDNCQVLCSACHLTKTTERDVPSIAKAVRQHRKHIGIKKPATFRRPNGIKYDWRRGRYVRQEAT